jgi:hypothetical protein
VEAGAQLLLAEAEVTAARWNVQIPKFVDILNAEPPADSLVVSLEPNLDLKDVPAIEVDVIDSSGIGRTRLDLRDLPRIADGVLTVNLAIPTWFRRQYAGYRLDLSIFLGSRPFLLGSWPMAAISDDLAVPVNEVPDTILECTSILGCTLTPMGN